MIEFDYNVEQLQEVLNSLDMVDIDSKDTDNHVLKVLRIKLQTAKQKIGKLMADTSTKDYAQILADFEDGEIEEYITCILESTWEADASKARSFYDYEDIQNLRCLGDKIKVAVEYSPFGVKNFKIKHLQSLRTKLAASKTIHELRQNCKIMAAQLEYYRASEAAIAELTEMNKWLSKETDHLHRVAEDAFRVVNGVVPFYDAGMDDIALLKNIESAKNNNKLSDTEAAKLFGVSRKKLLTLRKDIHIESLTEEEIEAIRSEYKSEMVEIIVEDFKEKKPPKPEYEFPEEATTLDDILPYKL